MADIDTYTATPCGPSSQPTYEISVVQAAIVPLSNLAAVQFADNPPSWICCTINRSNTNQTPEEDVKTVEDSGYALADCEDCNDHWS